MKLAVIGSQKYEALWKVKKYIDRLTPDVILLTGGTTPPDVVAAQRAKERKLKTKILRPEDNPSVHPRFTTLVLHTTMAKECERMVAFWDGKDKDVLAAIQKAVEYGRTVEINPEDLA